MFLLNRGKSLPNFSIKSLLKSLSKEIILAVFMKITYQHMVPFFTFGMALILTTVSVITLFIMTTLGPWGVNTVDKAPFLEVVRSAHLGIFRQTACKINK